MANQTLDNFLYFSNGYGCIQAQDANHQIIIRADRNGTPSDYTNHYQYGGTIAAGLGHKFWTGGVLASQTLKFHIADDGNYFACKVGIGTSTPIGKLDVSTGGNTNIVISNDSTDTGYNIISLNGSGAANGGIVVRDATAASLVSGSLLWNTTTDKWIAGPLGSEIEIATISGTQTLTNKTINGSQLVDASVANGKLTNSSITVTAGTGMSGGGTPSLGGTVTLTNAGVTSNVAGTGIGVSAATGGRLYLMGGYAAVGGVWFSCTYFV